MRAYRRTVIHRRVVVNLVDRSAISGILWNEVGDLLILRDATLHEPGNVRPVSIDGEALVERSRIHFVQAIGG